jgi:hypothetical protein
MKTGTVSTIKTAGDLAFMFNKIKMSYLISGISFLVIAFVGGRYLFWRQEAFAFLLITYLIVVIGIRLDEIVGRLNEIQAQLTQLRDRQTRQ